MARLIEGSVRLEPATIPCDYEDGAGRRCGAEAAVWDIQYRYGGQEDSTVGELRSVLYEIHYCIYCPICGPRVQVELA